MTLGKGYFTLSSIAAAVLCLAGCGQSEFSVLTYNVAGLPEGFSASSPSENSERIGASLNDFDVALVQEDFAYHDALTRRLRHPYRRPTVEETAFNESGLARFSNLPLLAFRRWSWQACHGTSDAGSDCLTPKGFSLAQHEVSLDDTSVVIDVYNLHMDAGDGPGDEAARRAQALQLLEVIASRSRLHPVVVAGDTNVAAHWDAPLVALRSAGFRDACAQLDCPSPGIVDRVLYRGSAFVTLEPLRWRIPAGFEDDEGNPLSDHLPVAVDFEVRVEAGAGPSP